MVNVIAVLTSLILIVLSFPLPGRAAGSMTCTVSQAAPEKCTPYPVLEYADLTISEKDRFSLQARYSACYHSDEITITGKVKRFSYHNGEDIELLATEIQLSPTIIQRFPRTIGTITLKNGPMKGYFFDIWNSIRTRGVYHQAPFSRVIRCENDEL